jgi:hypothetical protein
MAGMSPFWSKKAAQAMQLGDQVARLDRVNAERARRAIPLLRDLDDDDEAAYQREIARSNAATDAAFPVADEASLALLPPARRAEMEQSLVQEEANRRGIMEQEFEAIVAKCRVDMEQTLLTMPEARADAERALVEEMAATRARMEQALGPPRKLRGAKVVGPEQINLPDMLQKIISTRMVLAACAPNHAPLLVHYENECGDLVNIPIVMVPPDHVVSVRGNPAHRATHFIAPDLRAHLLAVGLPERQLGDIETLFDAADDPVRGMIVAALRFRGSDVAVNELTALLKRCPEDAANDLRALGVPAPVVDAVVQIAALPEHAKPRADAVRSTETWVIASPEKFMPRKDCIPVARKTAAADAASGITALQIVIPPAEFSTRRALEMVNCVLQQLVGLAPRGNYTGLAGVIAPPRSYETDVLVYYTLVNAMSTVTLFVQWLTAERAVKDKVYTHTFA